MKVETGDMAEGGTSASVEGGEEWSGRPDAPYVGGKWSGRPDAPYGGGEWSGRPDAPYGGGEWSGRPDAPYVGGRWSWRPDAPHGGEEISGRVSPGVHDGLQSAWKWRGEWAVGHSRNSGGSCDSSSGKSDVAALLVPCNSPRNEDSTDSESTWGSESNEEYWTDPDDPEIEFKLSKPRGLSGEGSQSGGDEQTRALQGSSEVKVEKDIAGGNGYSTWKTTPTVHKIKVGGKAPGKNRSKPHGWSDSGDQEGVKRATNRRGDCGEDSGRAKVRDDRHSARMVSGKDRKKRHRQGSSKAYGGRVYTQEEREEAVRCIVEEVAAERRARSRKRVDRSREIDPKTIR